MAVTVTTEPSSEPLTLAQAKAHLNITDSSDDTLINRLIKTARRRIETQTAHRMLPTGLRLTLSAFPRRPLVAQYTDPMPPLDAIILPGGKVSSITSIGYIDTAGTSKTMTLTNTVSDLAARPAYIVPAPDNVWPETQPRPGAVTVDYTAGWADTTVLPDEFTQAMLLLIGHFYANRESVNIGNIVNTIPMSVEYLLDDFRSQLWSFGG